MTNSKVSIYSNDIIEDFQDIVDKGKGAKPNEARMIQVNNNHYK